MPLKFGIFILLIHSLLQGFSQTPERKDIFHQVLLDNFSSTRYIITNEFWEVSKTSGFKKEKIVIITVSDNSAVVGHPKIPGYPSLDSIVKKSFRGIDPSTIDNFISNNQTKVPLDSFPELIDSLDITFVTATSIEKILLEGKSEMYSEFKRIFGEASLVSLSNVGFNSTLTQALIYSSSATSGLTGSGHISFYVKENGTWNLKAKLTLWIS